MDNTVPAIYEGGVFRPLVPCSLPEGKQVSLRIDETEPLPEESSEEMLARQREAIAELLHMAETHPLEGEDDGFSGEDHDKVLYGSP